MSLLEPIAFQVITSMSQLFDFYFYTVSVLGVLGVLVACKNDLNPNHRWDNHPIFIYDLFVTQLPMAIKPSRIGFEIISLIFPGSFFFHTGVQTVRTQ